MVQLKCPECGKKFSTPTAKCPHCGSQINKDGKVMVISLVKNLFDFPDFYRNPTIEIRQKGFKHVAEVNYKEKFELAIDKECELIFKCNYVNLPFATCEVKPGDVVYLTYDKGLNCLRTIKVHNKEYNIPVVDKTNKHKVNIKRIFAILGVCALFVGLMFLDSYLKDVIRSKKAQTQYEWIYGDWECETPYGTIQMTICKDGRIYNSVDEAWHSYSLDGSKLVEQCDGYISTYPIDPVRKQIGSGEPGYWFHKVYSSSSKSSTMNNNNKSMREISSHPWKRILEGDPYGACVLEVLSFSADGHGNCREIRYAGGNAVKASNFDFSYYIEEDKVYCEGSWEYNFRNGKLYDKQNHQYKSGSDLFY